MAGKEKIKSWFKSGKKFNCPFCNNAASEMLPIGYDIPVLKEKKVVGGGKRFGGCKDCGSIDRERLIYIYLKEVTALFNSGTNKSILHIAPEVNLSKKILEKGFQQYICGDLFAEGYHYPRHVQNINVLDIPYADNSFDLVICNHVLEHIEDDRKAMKEINRVLKKGGQAILQVPFSKNSEKTLEDFSITDPKEREELFGQYDHIRIYGLDYIQRLESTGFTVSRINISDTYEKYGLNKDEDIFVCIKS